MINNAAPTIDSSEITDITDIADNTLDPQTNYKFKITVTDANTLADISTLELKLYVDNILLPDSARNHYTFKFTAPNTWEEIGPDTTEGHLVVASCVAPDNTLATGTYIFVVKFDATAEPTTLYKWDIWAKVTDASAASGERTDENQFDINEYISLTIDDSALTFSGNPGTNDVTPAEQATIAMVDANVNFNVQVKLSGDWSGVTYGGSIPMANTQMAQTKTEAQKSLSATYQNLWSNVGYGNDVTREIYWFLNIPSPLRDDTYTTTFYVNAVKY